MYEAGREDEVGGWRGGVEVGCSGEGGSGEGESRGSGGGGW